MRRNRRDAVGLALTMSGAVLVGKATETLAAPQHESAPSPVDGREALQRLREGNERFANGRPRHVHQGQVWRKQLAAGQHPFATILGCSDSRVPTELVFDQGLGDLFVIRVAGNVMADDIVGSIEYAGLHLQTPLFVVMGHQGCGAVTATLQARAGGATEPEGIQSLLGHIEPAIRGVDITSAPDQQLERAVEANVRWSLQQLRALPEAQMILNEHKFISTGAVYELDSGRVRWLQEADAP